MTKERIGIVGEGSTDLAVLNEFLPRAVDWLSPENLINIQPSADKTSTGGSPNGSWGMVQKWCLSNPPVLRKQIALGGGLFEESEPGPSLFDSILVQLDADVCEDPSFQSQSSIKPNDYDLTTPIGRGLYITAVISDWLWPDGDVDDDESWTVIGPSVEAIETWLIAGLTDIKEPEKIKPNELSKEFVRAVFKSEGQPVPKDAKQIRKRVSRYKKLSERAANNISDIIERCPHFASLVERISNL